MVSIHQVDRGRVPYKCQVRNLLLVDSLNGFRRSFLQCINAKVVPQTDEEIWLLLCRSFQDALVQGRDIHFWHALGMGITLHEKHVGFASRSLGLKVVIRSGNKLGCA